jgi:DNA invertase Pin-like site-specific DNA recombinase
MTRPHALPETTEQLRGLRCARLLRESSRGQRDRKGPATQRRMQDEAIARLGLIDGGTERLILNSAWSGSSGDREPPALTSTAMRDLIECGEPVLVAGYASRFMRSTTDAGTLIRELHRRGTVLYIAADDLLSTRDHGDIIAKVLTAWNYSTDLSRTMHATYYQRFIEDGLPAGVPPFGFTKGWEHDPETAPIVEAIFRRYAEGGISLTDLALYHGLRDEHVKVIVRNPAYKGIARFNGEERPASFEAIVDPELWQRVADLRASRRWRTGGRHPATPSPIRAILWCRCGRRIRLDGKNGTGTQRVRHMRPLCEYWGSKERRPASDFVEPIKQAVRLMQPTDEFLTQLLSEQRQQAPQAPRNDASRRRALADDYSAGRITMEAFTSQIEALTALETAQPAPERPELTLQDLRWYFDRFMDAANDQPDEDGITWTSESDWAHIVRMLFERLEHYGDNDMLYTPTREAAANFVDRVMPTQVQVGGPVGGEGLEPPTFSV